MNPKPQVKKVVLAYSGGLDTSVIVPWLKENYGCEVVCFCADVGQGDEDLSKLEGKAIASGASQFVVHDMKEELASDFLFPLLRAGAVYERKYLLGTSVARPLIAKHLVDVAHEVGADAVAHGATGKGNDQVRFELTVMALDPRLRVIAPWREWEIRSREDAIEFAAKHNVPVTATYRTRAACSKIHGTSRKNRCTRFLPPLRTHQTSLPTSRSSSTVARQWRSMARRCRRPASSLISTNLVAHMASVGLT
jgi:argininosuccinate synthase